jgi:DNA polymerase V
MEIGEDRIRLLPANENNTRYQPIEISPENNFMVWGVVTYVIKKM